MLQVDGSGSRRRATPLSSNPSDQYDDTEDNGYVSLNRDGAGEYRQDGHESQSDQWVDEEADTVPRLAANSSSRAAQPSSPLRKRRRGSRAPSAGSRTPRATSHPPSQLAQGPPSSSVPSRLTTTDAFRRQSRHATPAPAPAPVAAPAARPPSPPPPPLPLPTARMTLHHTLTFVVWLCEYIMSIVRPVVRFLRYPLILLILLFIVACLLNKITSTLVSAFSPICYIPGFSFFPMCKWIGRIDAIPPPGAHGKVMWADFPGLAGVQSRTFDQLVDKALASGTSGSGLALNIKKAEMATADLVALVRLSDLNSKDSLVDTLSEFIQDAKITEKGLHRLDARVNGAIDSIMAMNDFAFHTIASARANEPSEFDALMIWKPRRKTLNEVVKETFTDAMYVMSTHIERLILEHEVNDANLGKLEEKLTTLHEIITREDKSVSEAKEDLLADLWTKLGYYKKELRNFNRNLDLLRDLTEHREQARAYIAAALQTLRTMDHEMHEMRERVAAPNLAGDRVPPEVHMNSIKTGLERLKEGRSRAKRIGEEVLRKALGVDENGRGLDS